MARWQGARTADDSAGGHETALSRRESDGEAVAQVGDQFRRLVQSVTDYAILMLDAEGRVVSWNPGAERIKGYQADEILGEHFSRFYTEEDRRRGMPEQLLATAAAQGRIELEGWRVRKDGSRFLANIVIDCITDENGNLIGFAEITRDITERQRLQDALELTQATLLQSQKMEAIGQLTGGIAHDFNNLLTSIIGSIDLLERQENLKPEQRQRLLETVKHAAERGASLTQRLLTFSRRQTLDPRDVDVNELVGDMSEMLQRTLSENIQVRTVLAGGIWYSFVDPNQLENALLNLAINARDAMPEGGTLTIETGNTYLDDDYARMNPDVTPGQYVIVAVGDTGHGMAPEIQARAFEPFYTTKPPEQGTGLGLSQVYGFVKQSGGHVKLESEVGRGTIVRLYLPRLVAGSTREDEPQRDDDSILGAGETILFVEDDKEVSGYIRFALRMAGYRVLHAEDAETALRLLDDHPEVALLFTDVGLPGMNGRQLAKAARRKSPRLKVLLTSGYARDAVLYQGLLDLDLLPKPFTVEVLARKLRQVLHGG